MDNTGILMDRPSRRRFTTNYGQAPFFVGKPTISMAMFQTVYHLPIHIALGRFGALYRLVASTPNYRIAGYPLVI